jgi:hypothetical protein
MKKFLTAVVVSSVLLMNTAFANKNENVNYQVENSFKKEFSQAKEVNWQKTENYYKASFKMYEEPMTAYFTPEGELIGVIRNLLSTQLPINLQTSLKKEYGSYWITELFEFARPESNGYFITIQDADQSVTLQSTNAATWTVYSKTKK